MNKSSISEAVKYVLGIYKRNSVTIFKMILLLVLIMVGNMFMPTLSAHIIDKGLCNNDIRLVILYSGLIFFIHVIMSLIYMLIERCRLKGYNSVQMELKTEAIDKLALMRDDFFGNKNTTEIYQQLDEDIKNISGCFCSEIVMALIQIFITFGLIPVLFSISWKLTLFMILAIPMKLLKTLLFSKYGYDNAKQLVEKENKYSALISEFISGMRTIRCFGLESHFKSVLYNKQINIAKTQVKNGMLQELNVQTEAMIADLLTSISYVVASFLIVKGEISIGNFIAFQTYSLSVLDFVGMFLNVGYSFSILMPSFERYCKFISEDIEDSGKEELINACIKVDVCNVTFSYNDGTSVFEDLNLEIDGGSHIAILGSNGCGKTTFVNLLLRFYKPQLGKIYYNGQDISNYSINSYRKMFVVSSQKTFLFCDSIRNNISLFKNIDEQRLKWAIECVGLKELVEEKTLDYCVGQDGCELSGGQRQRISLARTLVSDAPVVILDEPETSIDIEFEHIFKRIVKECYKDRTVIIITHHKELLCDIDKIYNLSDLVGKR